MPTNNQTYYQIPVFQQYLNRSDLSYQEKIILKEGLSKYFIFSKLNEEQLVEAIKYSKYIILQPKEVVFNIGDSLEYFYVIIKGSVSQYCTEYSYEMAKSKQKQNNNSNENQQILATMDSTSQKLFRIKILNEGDYLGEQGLLNIEQNHQSALQAVADGPEVHLLCININMYKQYLQTASRNHLINDISIMSSNHIFDNWQFDMIRLLYFFSVKSTFYNGQTLFKQNDHSKAVYIILKGEFGVYKTFKDSEGKKLKSQGNKKNLSDDECSESDSEDIENNNNNTNNKNNNNNGSSFNKQFKKTMKQQQQYNSISSDESEDNENEESNQFTIFSTKVEKQSSLTQRKSRQHKRSKVNESLDFIPEIEDAETEYFQPSSKTMDIKQVKSLCQINKSNPDQVDQIIPPTSTKKIPSKSKVFLYPSKDDSLTPKMITQKKNKLFQLYSLGANQIFGEEDVMKKCKRSFTVKCNSYGGGVLLIIPNSSSEMFLKKNLEVKEKRFAERVKMIQENIEKYKNYFFENNQDNATPKNPLRAKRQLVEKDCINIDDFIKASKKQVVLDKSTKLHDLNQIEKAKLKKDNASLFSAEMISERIATFTSPNLKKIDLFNFKNDICKVENPPSIHAIFENELKKAMKGQTNSSLHQSSQNTNHNYSSNHHTLPHSQPTTSRNPNSSNTNNINSQNQNKQEQKFIVKTGQQFYKPKLNENNIQQKTVDQLVSTQMMTSLSQNNSGLFNSNINNNFMITSTTPNPPLLKKQPSKSDPHIKLPPSIEQLNKMGQSGLLDIKQSYDEINNNSFLVEKDQIKKDILLKQQYLKIEQSNNPTVISPEKRSSSFSNTFFSSKNTSQNEKNNNYYYNNNNGNNNQNNNNNNSNNNNQKLQYSRKNKAQKDQAISHSSTYIQPIQNQVNVPKLNSETKPMKKNIFLETFTKGFFKNMKGIFYKNFNNQQGSLNSYSSIQESIAKHVLDPQIKQFLVQNPGILASKEKQIEFLRVPDKSNSKQINKTTFIKSNPDFKPEDLLISYNGEQQESPLKRPFSAKGNLSLKLNIQRNETTNSQQFLSNTKNNNLDKQSYYNSISPQKIISPNKYKRTQSAMELETSQLIEDDLSNNNHHPINAQHNQQFNNDNSSYQTFNNKPYLTNSNNYYYNNQSNLNQEDQNQKRDNQYQINVHTASNNQLKNQSNNQIDTDSNQNEKGINISPQKRFYRKQVSLQGQQFERKNDNPQQISSNYFSEKIPLKLPVKSQHLQQQQQQQIQQQQTFLNIPQQQPITYSTYNNFFKPSPVQHLKTNSSQLYYKKPMTQNTITTTTTNSLSPELPKNKGTINKIFGSSATSLTNSINLTERNNINNMIALNSCSKQISFKQQQQQKQLQLSNKEDQGGNNEDIYKSQKNELFRQKIENDKNLIKMTNLFTTH